VPSPARSLGAKLLAVSLPLLLAACGGQSGQGFNLALPKLINPSPAPGYAVPAPQVPAPSNRRPSLAELTANPARFEGMTGSDVLGLMGAPSYRRTEPPAQVWQFYGGACVLDLFLYQQSDDLAVAHAELRSRNAGQNPNADCMRQVLADRHKV
jgi:hypothetical protein